MIMIIVQSGRVTSDEEEADYDYTSKWEYLGKGIWENQVSCAWRDHPPSSPLVGLRDSQ